MRPNLTCDRLRTGCASFRKQFAVTVGTVRLLVFRCEPLSGQLQVALRAREALPMPWLVTVGHTSSSNDLRTEKNDRLGWAMSGFWSPLVNL